MDGLSDVSVDHRVRRWNLARSLFAFLTLAGVVFCIASVLGTSPHWV